MRLSEIYNVGVTPSSLVIHCDSAYVCNSNNYGIPNADSVTVLNLKTKTPKMTIHHESFNEPYRAVAYKDKIYVTNSASPSVVGQQGTVSVIDTKTNSVCQVIEGFDGPSAIAIKKSKMYVTNYGAAGGLGSGNGTTISVVDLKTGLIINTITTDLAPAALAFSSCRKYLYCANYTTGLPGTGTINVINLKDNTITSTINGLFGPFGIVVSKCNIAYVTNFGSNNFAPFGNTVSVVDMCKLCILRDIETGIQPAGICLTDKYLYVSNYNALYASPINYTNLTYGESTINKIDLECNKVVDTIKGGQTISSLVCHCDKIYFTSYTLNIVQTLDLC